MPFQPINFASLPVQGDPGARGLPEALASMFNTARTTYGMLQEADQQKLQKQIQQAQLAETLQKAQRSQLLNDIIRGGKGGKSTDTQAFDSDQRFALPKNSPNSTPLTSTTPADFTQDLIKGENPLNLSSEERHSLIRKFLGIPNELSGDKEQREKNIIDYKSAQEAKDPFSKVGLSGNMAQALGLSMIKRRYGENSEEYKDARRIYDADVKSRETLNMYRSNGATSPAAKAQMYLESQVAADNPNIQDIRGAVNAISSGQTTLPDGTKLNVSPAARNALDAIAKLGTTAQVLNSRYNRQSKEAEMPVINTYISKGMAPYGNTLGGISPELEVDMLKSDDVSQKKVGQFLASQQLNTERANIANALAQGPAGVTLINQMIDDGAMRIKHSGLKISNKARQEAIRYYSEGIQKAVDASLKAPSNASAILSSPKEKKKPIFNLGTGAYE